MSATVGISITAWLILSTYCFVAMAVVNPRGRLSLLQWVIAIIGYSGPAAWCAILIGAICAMLENKK